MSTRCTIAHDKDWHLYQECFEQDNVYLQLDGGGWSASLETAVVDWRDGESTHPQLYLKIDVTMWRKIVEGWIASHWANSPERDHKKIEFDQDAAITWLESLKRNKEELP